MKTFYDKLARPPKDALKTINGGRLKGMTDINPQWRYKALTDEFGPCGVGWKFEIERIWHEQGTDGQVFCFAQIHLFFNITSDGESICWSSPIPGVGGSMLITMESAGLRCNDEAIKMAVTDALSTAMKMIGVGADIYAGRFDGSKYKDEQPPQEKKTPKTPAETIPFEEWENRCEAAWNEERLEKWWHAYHAKAKQQLNKNQYSSLEQLYKVLKDKKPMGLDVPI